MKIPIKRLTEDAKIPTRGSEHAAGYDLTFCQNNREGYPINGIVLAGESRITVGTGVCVAIPSGHYGRIAPRSGLASKHGINVLGGVIDADYRGEIKVVLHNTFQEPFVFERGDRIAQLIIERCFDAEFIEFDSLPESERGSNGFGSTGRAQLAQKEGM